MANKILIVDDDKKLVRLIKKYMDAEGFEARTVGDGPSGLSEARRFKPDVIILDVMMPGFDGIELIKKLHPESTAYVIMLTAKSEETDKIVGLRMGADDYMVKPFSPRELVARVNAALRRMKVNASTDRKEIYYFPDLEVDTASRIVKVKSEPVVLTKTEFDLLETLARNEGIALPREQLLLQVWGYDFIGESRVVDVHIGNLRSKLAGLDYIKTIRGIGYKFSRDK
jgi:two-component system alkaline phosphatase synthesis response regulator PhoP